MDYSKTRCPVCLSRFCCVEHKDQHIQKNHTEVLKSYSQDYLLKTFKRKAERIMTNAQKYKAHIRQIEELAKKSAVNTNSHKNKLGNKRPHSEMNQHIVSRSIIIESETRKILVPAHRSMGKTSSTNGMEPKACTHIEVKKNSPCDVSAVKTSTPIIENYSAEDIPQSTLHISQTSSICNYHTPLAFGSYQKASMSIYETPPNFESHSLKSEELELLNSQLHRVKKTKTSPRSIMSKLSKYDNEIGPSPNPNTSKIRRVTFSFSSSNNSPLELVQEEEICKEIKTDDVLESDEEKDNCIEVKNHPKERLGEINKYTEGLFQEDIKAVCNQPNKVKNYMDTDLSSSESKKSGFFNCVTDMICSAVPIFASWRESQTDQVNRSKRLRSPDAKRAGVEGIGSPQLKRLCYPFDLRLNPIKARRPISGV